MSEQRNDVNGFNQTKQMKISHTGLTDINLIVDPTITCSYALHVYTLLIGQVYKLLVDIFR